ncbi:MAG: hypothetical protein A2168_08670 [Planctomycetes bacterium RBG_13_50_24]|nr:MAG: hypothetical protein A2168_08670 [Planctomycetes bacterium RBG_13_50_24]
MNIIPPEDLITSFFYFRKYVSNNMGVSAGQVKAPMGSLSQSYLFAAAVRRPKGNAVNVTCPELVCPTVRSPQGNAVKSSKTPYVIATRPIGRRGNLINST